MQCMRLVSTMTTYPYNYDIQQICIYMYTQLRTYVNISSAHMWPVLMKWYISRADTFSARAKNRRRAQLFYFSLPYHNVSILGYILKNNWNFIIYVVFVGFYVFCTRIALNCILHFNVIMCIVFFFS